MSTKSGNQPDGSPCIYPTHQHSWFPAARGSNLEPKNCDQLSKHYDDQYNRCELQVGRLNIAVGGVINSRHG